MSYANLFVARHSSDRRMVLAGEYHNGWGAAAAVWIPLVERYTGPFDWNGLHNLLNGDTLARMALFERLLTEWTFEGVVTTPQMVPHFILATQLFLDKYPAEGRVCHLPQIGSDMMQLVADDDENDIIGFGMWHTTVGNNVWITCDEQTGECEDVRVDLNVHRVLGEDPTLFPSPWSDYPLGRLGEREERDERAADEEHDQRDGQNVATRPCCQQEQDGDDNDDGDIADIFHG